jgi:hypothetical protein
MTIGGNSSRMTHILLLVSSHAFVMLESLKMPFVKIQLF